jgi:hypothetical protein
MGIFGVFSLKKMETATENGMKILRQGTDYNTAGSKTTPEHQNNFFFREILCFSW